MTVLVVTVVTVTLIINVGLIEPASACSQADQLTGGCGTAAPVVDVTVDPDDGVTLKAVVVDPGGSGGDGAGQRRASKGGAKADPPSNGEKYPLRIYRDNYTAMMPLTVADLVNFTPTLGTAQMQPSGWMAVGLDTNFYARASSHVKTGVLLEQPASVRFTPVQYRWSYGDGTVATRGTAGATWQALGVHEFDPTPTGHIYRAPGTYYIDLAIGFAAEYRYDSFRPEMWVPVQGIVWAPANRLVAVAGGPKTVLVEKECTINPRGPGC